MVLELDRLSTVHERELKRRRRKCHGIVAGIQALSARDGCRKYLENFRGRMS